MTKENVQILQKRNVWLVVFLSIITMGIYIGYWFLSTKASFQLIDKKNFIPFKWWVVATIFLILSLIISIVGEFLLTMVGLYMLDSIDLIFTYFFIGLLYYSIFRMRESLEYYEEEVELNKYLLFFLHIWYLQYKINQVVENRGMAYEKA